MTSTGHTDNSPSSSSLNSRSHPSTNAAEADPPAHETLIDIWANQDWENFNLVGFINGSCDDQYFGPELVRMSEKLAKKFGMWKYFLRVGEEKALQAFLQSLHESENKDQARCRYLLLKFMCRKNLAGNKKSNKRPVRSCPHLRDYQSLTKKEQTMNMVEFLHLLRQGALSETRTEEDQKIIICSVAKFLIAPCGILRYGVWEHHRYNTETETRDSIYFFKFLQNYCGIQRADMPEPTDLDELRMFEVDFKWKAVRSLLLVFFGNDYADRVIDRLYGIYVEVQEGTFDHLSWDDIDKLYYDVYLGSEDVFLPPCDQDSDALDAARQLDIYKKDLFIGATELFALQPTSIRAFDNFLHHADSTFFGHGIALLSPYRGTQTKYVGARSAEQLSKLSNAGRHFVNCIFATANLPFADLQASGALRKLMKAAYVYFKGKAPHSLYETFVAGKVLVSCQHIFGLYDNRFCPSIDSTRGFIFGEDDAGKKISPHPDFWFELLLKKGVMVTKDMIHFAKTKDRTEPWMNYCAAMAAHQLCELLMSDGGVFQQHRIKKSVDDFFCFLLKSDIYAEYDLESSLENRQVFDCLTGMKDNVYSPKLSNILEKSRQYNRPARNGKKKTEIAGYGDVRREHLWFARVETNKFGLNYLMVRKNNLEPLILRYEEIALGDFEMKHFFSTWANSVAARFPGVADLKGVFYANPTSDCTLIGKVYSFCNGGEAIDLIKNSKATSGSTSTTELVCSFLFDVCQILLSISEIKSEIRVCLYAAFREIGIDNFRYHNGRAVLAEMLPCPHPIQLGTETFLPRYSCDLEMYGIGGSLKTCSHVMDALQEARKNQDDQAAGTLRHLIHKMDTGEITPKDCLQQPIISQTMLYKLSRKMLVESINEAESCLEEVLSILDVISD